jgi:hypothetical protein
VIALDLPGCGGLEGPGSGRIGCNDTPSPAGHDGEVTEDDVRALALALEGTTEAPHHQRTSFRVGGKIFATLWDERTMNVMVDEPGIRTAVAEYPRWCAERYWGKRLAAVAVDLSAAPEHELRELLADAWEGKAERSAT